MQHKNKFLFAVLLLIFAGQTFLIHAQSDKKPARLLVMQDVVFPYKAMEYETAQKAMNDFIVKNKLGMNWEVYQTDEFTYMYCVPFSSMSDIDALFKMWDDKMKASDKNEFNKVYKGFTGTISHNNSYIVELIDSYAPKNANLKPEDAGFIHWDFFDLLPGKDMEGKALLSDYKKANEKLNIPVGYKLWSVVFGDHSSSVIFTTLAKDDVDFYTHNKETDDKLMKEPGGAEMYQKFFACLSGFHHYNGKPRADLSIAPSK